MHDAQLVDRRITYAYRTWLSGGDGRRPRCRLAVVSCCCFCCATRRSFFFYTCYFCHFL